MKRKFTLLAAALMLLSCLAVPLGMRGQTRAEEVYSTCLFGSSYNSNSTNNYTSTWTTTNGSFTWTIVNGNNNQNKWNYVKFGRSGTASVGQIETSAAYSVAVTKVVLTIDAITASNINSIKLYTSSNNSSWTEAGTFTKATGAQTVTLSSPTASLYYKIEFDCASGSSNGLITISKVEYYHNVGNPTVATPIFNPNGGSFTDSQAVEISCSTQGAAIHYSYEENPSEWLDYPAAGLTLTETTTVYAYATKEGMDDSPVNSASFTKLSFDDIEDITESGTNYTVRGTVVAVSARAFVLGDGTGYVYYYNGYTAPSVSVGQKKIVSGTTSDYGHIIQFPSSAQISATETSNYDGTPTATNITAIPTSTYSEGLHLSDYFQFEGTLTKSGGYYYVAVGEGQINIAYPSSDQQTTMNALVDKNVRVKGYFAGINSSNYFSVLLESVEEVVGPTISINPATANPFTYVLGSGPSDYQVFEVTGSNLTSADIVATISEGASYFEVSDDDVTYSNTVTIASGDPISIRMKAGLAKGSYSGKLTLSSTGATDVEVSLSGTVSGQTFNINTTDAISNGTVTCSPASPVEEGTTVTLSAEAAAGYDFVADSWVIYDENLNETGITVTNNQFTMPDYGVIVGAEFSEKTKYGITCSVTPTGAALMEASPATAYEGQTVTLTYVPETGYTLTSIVITKTDDGTATGINPTASGDDYTFTMPGYAVTATATFISDTFEGNFVLFTGDFEEGDYILVYEGRAMTDTVKAVSSSNSKFTSIAVSPTNNMITDPSAHIVWHIAPLSGSDAGYWTIYNAAVKKYANGASTSNTNVSLVDIPTYTNGAKWSVTKKTDEYEFGSKLTSGSRVLRESGDYFGHYSTSTNGTGPLTLYKYTVLTERTITFNGNGGTYNNENTYTQTVYDGIAANLDANQFTKDGSAFIGWSTTANGEVEYADGASITVNDDLPLYAQWATSYTAMVDNQIVGGTVKVNGEDNVQVAAGTEMTLTYTSNTSYAFRGWNVYKNGDETIKVTVTGNTFEMPEYDVIVSATFENVTTYSLVTDVNQIVSGKHYIIASGSIGEVRVMSSQTKNNNRTSVEATALWDEVIQETEGIYEFVINGPFTFNNKSCYTIYDKNELSTGYLCAASSSSNQLKTQSTLDDNGKWTIEIGEEDHEATIKAQGDKTRNWMRNNGTLFSCYGSGQHDIYLFVKDNDNDYEYYGCELTYSETSIDGSITVGAGSVMTVLGGFTNSDPDKLIVKDGGQLICNNDVTATLQKDITAASHWGAQDPENPYTADGWYFVASPVNGADVSLATTGDYDLYSYDEDGGNNGAGSWYNQKAHTIDFTTFSEGIGYLYANSANQTLSFTGTMKATNTTVTVPLSWASTDSNIKGYNLVGNPFTRNITSSDMKLATTENETTTYSAVSAYYMVENGTEIIPSTADIKPGRGFLVQATAANQQLVFNHTSRADGYAKPSIISIEAGNESFMDRALVQIGGGNTLRKMTINDNVPHVYVINDGKDYAAATIAEAQGEMPVNFKANENGQYILTVNAENVEMNYLHLIDNMTGADIDLLQTPSYTFNAKTYDYESRFRLVFAANGEDGSSTGSETFSFFSNGNWVINNEGNATLQVIDALGRILSNESISGTVSKNIDAPAGVYVLRLINGENVKTQKIVVR